MDPTYDELRRENQCLKRKNEQLDRDNEGLSRRIATLETQVQRLTKLLEVSQRQAKRQAAPFRKSDDSSRKPNKAGRKKGKRHGAHAHRQPPPRIDEHDDVPLPEVCPHCGGRDFTETGVDTQYQTEIPRQPIDRQFDIHIGCCQSTCWNGSRGCAATTTSCYLPTSREPSLGKQ